jgi:hypothetical protein
VEERIDTKATPARRGQVLAGLMLVIALAR